MKVKVFIHAQYNEYEKTFTYHSYNCDMCEYGYTLIETQEVDVRQPTFEELTNKTIKALRNKQEKIMAAAHKETVSVQRVIDTLLCIEHKE